MRPILEKNRIISMFDAIVGNDVTNETRSSFIAAKPRNKPENAFVLKIL
jgi:hypothetical protein